MSRKKGAAKPAAKCLPTKKPKKPINSRAKGARAEVELANYLTGIGLPARRGQQFKGGSDSPDVVCESLCDWHIESKRVEAGNLYKWMEQAKRDCGAKKPLVVHRKNGKEWVVIMMLTDFLSEHLYAAI